MTATAPIHTRGHRTTAVATGLTQPVLQRKCACGGETQAGGECAECRKKRQGMLRRSALPRASARQDVAPAIVHDVLRSAGEPLERSARATMESQFGHDFSAVRVHADGRAAASARAVDAAAYTVGTHIVFGSGSYDPRSRDGQRLLAHELAHVRQQAAVSADVSAPLRIGPASDSYEAEAHDVASRVMDGTSRVFVREAAAPIIQRQPTGSLVHDDSHTVFRPGLPFEKYSEGSEAMYRRSGRDDVADAVRRCRERGADACAKLLTTEEARALYQKGRAKAGLSADAVVGGVAMGAMISPGGPGLMPPAYPPLPYPPPVYAPPVVTPPVVTPPVAPPPVGLPPVGPATAAAGVTAVEVASIAIPVAGAVFLVLATIDLMNYGQFEAALRREGYIVMPNPLAVCIGQCHTTAPSADWRRAPSPSSPRSIGDVDIATQDTIKSWTAPHATPAPQVGTQKEEDKKKPKAYPICWAIQLGPPPATRFSRVKSERDEDEAKQARMALEWRSFRAPDFNPRMFHVHHVIPLFLGGPDDLKLNATTIPKGLHLKGHRVLQFQPQMLKPPAPLPPLPANMYDHPMGTPYELVGFKSEAGEQCT